jgi:predicted HTH domain antitoxin
MENEQQKFVDNLVTLTEATRLTGLSLYQVQYAVKMGRIESVKFSRRALLLKDSLLEFARTK